jgi:hypothetical protein
MVKSGCLGNVIGFEAVTEAVKNPEQIAQSQ